ncbi:unnamed protein product [Adineta ricciae]|uniref:Uncharacterized protein n=1 Tax=Adineta ricciae TaxID=249248 RepID=A0A814G085_ADIRI|nr:unnamed protein product [Adineta ricciae]CAF1569384.1 unnamed protein product [Adineta ricciae]
MTTQKPARVTPRNIQFNDSVDIRQIPRNDEGGQGFDEQSWNPNLHNKGVFNDKPKKQKKVVIAIVVTGVIILAIVVAVVVGVIVSQKSSTTADNSLSYNQACSPGSNQCISSKGLYCPSGFCVCSSGTMWNPANSTCSFAKYNGSCTSPSQCDSSRGLSCNNSQCVCDAANYWNYNFQQCYPRLNYSEPCTFDSDCIPTLSCPTVAGVCNCSRYLGDYTCNCANTQYFDPASNQCVSRASYGGSCTASLNYTCLISLQCPSGTCNCPTGTSWNATATVCN